MKKIAFILLTLVMVASMSVLSVSAAAVMGTWDKVSDTEYSVGNHQNGNDYFDYYELGKSGEVTMSAELTIAPDGAQQSFLVGVVDVNGDGRITEGADQYYLVCFIWGGQVGIERNDKGWGGWATEAGTGFSTGDTMTLKVIYKKGTIEVYANNKLFLSYADKNSWDNGNGGFGLSSKSGNTVTFKNVSYSTTAIVGAGGVDVATAQDNANWAVDGNTYTLKIATPEAGYGNARFASYALGNATKKVTVTGKYTFNEFCKWGPDNGGDNGFLFAVADKNGDGKITEGGDFYYLVDVRTDGRVAIEKNAGRWGDWAKESGALGLEVGKEYTVAASYDPATATIVVTIDGNVVLEWTDPAPLAGTGYAIASKTPNFVMKDVTVTGAGAPVTVTGCGSWSFEDHHDAAKSVWLVCETWGVADKNVWASIKGSSTVGDVPDMENNKYFAIIDGVEYACDTATMYDGGDWGYLRLKLTGTDFNAKFNTEYTVSWKVEAKDGSWAYVGEEVKLTSFCGELPAAEAITGDGLAAIQGMTNLNGKVNQDSISTNVDTYNDTTETEKSVFDGNLTNKMGSGSTDVTITWSTTEAITVTDYVMVTGNDVENNSGRNPMLWTLYGSNDGKTWVVLDTVNYAGFEAVNSTAYGFHVDNPGAYTEYKLVLKSRGGFELGEMTLYSNPAPAPQPPVTDKPAQTGDMTALAVSMATLALIGTAVIVSKKRNYN